MFDQICLHNSKLFVPIIIGCNPFLLLYEHINLSKQNFREQARLEIPIRKSLKPKTVVVDTVENFILGLKCVVILVIGYSGDINVFIYSEILDTLIEIHYLECLGTAINPNDSVFVINGPLLVTFSNDLIDFYSFSLRNKANSLNVSSIFPLKYIKVLQVLNVGQIVKDVSLNVILLVLCGKVDNKQKIGIFACGISSNSIENCEKLSISTFFPEFLKTQARNVHICEIIVPKNVSELNEIKWKNNSVIVCSISDCFICFEGELKYVMVLPFQNISFIVENHNPQSLEDSSVILQSFKKEVALFKFKKDSNEFQLKKDWADIESVVVGDILMTGSKQMLLLKDGLLSSLQEDYILTDISSFVPVDILDQPTIPVECLNPTLSGLNTKLQTGKLAVAQKQHEIEDKTKAILDAVTRLKFDSGDCIENETSTFQDSLVNVILCNDENNKAEMYRRRDKQTLKTLNHWKKFFNKKWFICWTFQNENDSAICYPALKITIEDHKILCCQKVYVHSLSSTFSLEDNSSKQINPQETFSILSCVEFLHFAAKSVEVAAVLSWYSGSQAEFENELFLPQGEKLLAVNQISLTTCLDADCIFSLNHHELSVAEELFCLKLSQQKMVLRISNKFSNLLDMENILTSSELSSQHLNSIETSSSPILIFKNERSPLFGVHFKFVCLEENNIEIEAFIKNDDDLLLLLQFFHHCLPKDIVIIPCTKTFSEISLMKQKVVCAMKDETDFLIASLNAHNIYPQLLDSSKVQAGTIVIPKRTFLRIRRALVKKEYITDIIFCDIAQTQLMNKR